MRRLTPDREQGDPPRELQAQLPQLVSRASAWANALAETVSATGRPLSTSEVFIARQMGVALPGRVRVLAVQSIPRPEDPLLSEACAAADFLGPDTAGLTIGAGIILREDLDNDPALLAHELRHVAQYELLGSLEGFLGTYIPDVLRHGYERSPLEVDAREAAAAWLAGKAAGRLG